MSTNFCESTPGPVAALGGPVKSAPKLEPSWNLAHDIYMKYTK